MANPAPPPQPDDTLELSDGAEACLNAVETLYHALLTGLILAVNTRHGSAAAAEVVFRTFRRQQEAMFLPGLEKLGLRGLPDAVACAHYHYLSNAMGGVKVRCAVESDRKAWVWYPPPRWIWSGTAACGIPSEVSTAMLRGWHANNGVLLGNPRLGYVCTGQTVDGHPGLEGYFIEHDRALSPDERLRFAPGETPPRYDPAAMPRPPAADWDPLRLRLALRNYAMAYVRTILPIVPEVLGPEAGAATLAHAARLTGMQHYDAVAEPLGVADDSAEAFADWLTAILNAQGEAVAPNNDGGPGLRMLAVRFLRGEPPTAEEFHAWNALWEGALAVHNRQLRLGTAFAPSDEALVITWRVLT